ncbi:MAG: O-antigen ligase family protein, partial [Lachnospiraceae bacterium]|nr:O-antigen ligase family protein [Lachnospiraceae bacterium]
QLFENKILGIPEEKCLKSFDYAQKEAYSGEILVASTEVTGMMIAGEEEYEDQISDAVAYTNGRLEIFKLYLQDLNMTGHDIMGVPLPDGTLSVHAHNIYLQTAFDHGIPVGIAFIIFGFCTLVQAAIYHHRRKEDRPCSILPLALLVSFAVAGLTEWIFHPCNPITFCLLSALAPLLVDEQRRVKKKNLD